MRNFVVRFRSHARQIGVDSPMPFGKPRSGNWRKPMTDSMTPKTGSAGCLRKT
jgi:hypothetical protein